MIGNVILAIGFSIIGVMILSFWIYLITSQYREFQTGQRSIASFVITIVGIMASTSFFVHFFLVWLQVVRFDDRIVYGYLFTLLLLGVFKHGLLIAAWKRTRTDSDITLQ